MHGFIYLLKPTIYVHILYEICNYSIDFMRNSGIDHGHPTYGIEDDKNTGGRTPLG